MSQDRALARAALLVCLAVGLPAQAARMVTVTRGVGAGSDKAAALSGHFVRELLGKDERYDVVDLAKALGNQDRERALKAFQTAEEMVTKGRDAYDALELDAAVDFLTNALAKFERYAAYVGDFKKTSEALMLLGATHVLRGEEKLGTKRLEQAIDVYPQVEPDPRVFNAAMRSVFQETAARLANQAPGTLSITSNPGYAEVYLDGKFQGVTPIAVERVTEGRHYVRLERDGYRAWGKVVEITERSETAESAVLRPTTHFDDFDNAAEAAIKRLTSPSKVNSSSGVNDAVEQLGSLANADLVFLAQVRLDGEKVQVWANQYDLNARRLLKGADHVFTYDARNDTYEHEVGVMLHGGFAVPVPDAILQGWRDRDREVKRDKPRDRHERDRERDREADVRRLGEVETTPAEAGGLPGPNEGRCVFDWPCHTFKVASIAVGLGGGALFMVVGGVHWYLATRNHDTWSTTPMINPQSSQLSADGRSYALRGDVFFAFGAVLAVVGTSIYAFYDPSPSVEEVVSDSKSSASLFVAPTSGGLAAGAALRF